MDTAREQIISYLLGEQTLAEFEEWLTAATWDVDAATLDSETALDVQLLLAEYTRGDRTMAEVDTMLRRLIVAARIGPAPRVATTAANSAAEHSTRWVQPQIAAVGRRSAAARA